MMPIFVHVLWECPAFKDRRDTLMTKLWGVLDESFKDFNSLGNVERSDIYVF